MFLLPGRNFELKILHEKVLVTSLPFFFRIIFNSPKQKYFQVTAVAATV